MSLYSTPRLPSAISIGLPRLPHGNVRRRGRERWQARIYIGGRKGGSVHLGMYPSYEAASQVCRKILRTLLSTSLAAAEKDERAGTLTTREIGPLDVWRAARKLVSQGWDVDEQLAGLLPRTVCPDGRGGYGYRIKGGNGCDKGGFSCPLEAYRAAAKARKRARMKEMQSELETEATGVAVAS